MLLKKEGFPEDSELVLCTVKAVHNNCVFVVLDEYEKTGLVHISEVSPGRIRNIRDFVVEGKKIVCKVLRIDLEKGHIDLSLRRVNDGQKREKIDEIKQEQKAEKMLEYIAKNELKIPLAKLYDQIKSLISKKYSMFYECFEDVALGNAKLEDLGVDKKTAEVLTKLIKERIKPPEVFLEADVKLVSYASDGVETIKKALISAEEAGDISLLYEGGGKYKVRIKAPEYKEAEKILDDSFKRMHDIMDKAKGHAELIRAK